MDFNVGGFIRSIVNGYKDKFHLPVKRDVYHTEVGISKVIFLIVILLLVVVMWWMNGSLTS